MFSERFQLPIRLSRHAQIRMVERGVDAATVLDLVETGTLKFKDERRFWAFKHYEGREDNLICVAAALEDVLFVKTLMHHFTPED